MAWYVNRRVSTVAKEILVFPAGLDAIQSIVLSASGVSALPSATVGYSGKLGLLAGTILKQNSDDEKTYSKFTGSGTIAGILTDNVYFYDATQNEPAAMFFHGVVFNKDKIIDYSTHSAALATALPTCRFVEKTTPEEELEA